MMNIVFLGSASFAVPSLKILLARGYQISCVVTQPDKKKGRHLCFSPTIIKETASEAGLKILQPDNINSPQSIKALKELQPDLFIVISYGQILSEEFLNIPRIMAINIHASLLPAYRGAAPINWALIKGERFTGNTLIKIVSRMDAGPIILQYKREILDTDTVIILKEKLSDDAAQVLLEGLKLIENKNYNLLPQDDKNASYAHRLKKEDGLICWEKDAVDIYNLIRGTLDWPGAFCYYQERRLRIYKARIIGAAFFTEKNQPANIVKVSSEGIIISCGRDYLLIEELQLEGKRRMKASEFICGYKIRPGDFSGC